MKTSTTNLRPAILTVAEPPGLAGAEGNVTACPSVPTVGQPG
ncbi:MAG: hypothetical protein NTW21_08680 [Verrucomicrobia bacterium]|nr:hypothetical protein [Verrucomicrobiota bacterium]